MVFSNYSYFYLSLAVPKEGDGLSLYFVNHFSIVVEKGDFTAYFLTITYQSSVMTYIN